MNETRRMGRADLIGEIERLRAVPDLREHAVPCVFPLVCARCKHTFPFEYAVSTQVPLVANRINTVDSPTFAVTGAEFTVTSLVDLDED